MPQHPSAGETDPPRETGRRLPGPNDEQDRHQIETHVRFHPRVVSEGVEAAFIGADLLRVGLRGNDRRGENGIIAGSRADERPGSTNIRSAGIPLGGLPFVRNPCGARDGFG